MAILNRYWKFLHACVQVLRYNRNRGLPGAGVREVRYPRECHENDSLFSSEKKDWAASPAACRQQRIGNPGPRGIVGATGSGSPL